MPYKDFFSSTLGLSDPWKITHILFTQEEKRIDISLSFMQIDGIRCPICGKLNQMSYTVDEIWFHDNFFNYPTYLHTQVPYIQCCELVAVERPWSRSGSKFSQLN